MVVAVVGVAVAQTEAQTTIGLTLKIKTMMHMMPTKKTENNKEKRTKSRLTSSFSIFHLGLFPKGIGLLRCMNS